MAHPLPTTIPDLADMYGDLDAQIKALTDARDAVKAELAKRKTDTFKGDRWALSRTTYETTRLDTKLIRAEMGDDWCAAFTSTSSATRITVKPVAIGDVSLQAAA